MIPAPARSPPSRTLVRAVGGETCGVPYGPCSGWGSRPGPRAACPGGSRRPARGGAASRATPTRAAEHNGRADDRGEHAISGCSSRRCDVCGGNRGSGGGDDGRPGGGVMESRALDVPLFPTRDPASGRVIRRSTPSESVRLAAEGHRRAARRRGTGRWLQKKSMHYRPRRHGLVQSGASRLPRGIRRGLKTRISEPSPGLRLRPGAASMIPLRRGARPIRPSWTGWATGATHGAWVDFRPALTIR